MTQLAIPARSESRMFHVALLLAGILLATAAAWLTVAQRMKGMDGGPGGDPGALGWFAGTWALMTAAMMLPVAAPALLRVSHGWPSGAAARAPAFLLGYGAVWMLAGVAGYACVQAARSVHAGALGWSAAGSYLAAAAVAAAGLYQLTAVKRRWLARCTAQDLPRRREGIGGALMAGVEHGGCCVACCWTLMAALYALGMMSVTWMALVTVLIVGERMLPRAAPAVLAVGAVLLALGAAIAISPAAVPALTIPSRAHSAMMQMPMHVPTPVPGAPTSR